MPTYIHKDNNDKMYISYDASGNKLKQEVKTAQGYITNKREYIGSLVFAEDTLDYITTSYGRIKNGKREYFITDHLGNVRTIVDEDKKVLEKNNYYPYGLVITVDNIQVGNRKKYNGKESVTELDLDWYDYGARWYDAIITRWNVIDPMAEKMYNGWSPYNYTFGNPIKFIDIMGLIPGDPVKNPRIRGTKGSGIKGGLFGFTRKYKSGNPRYHGGVDIKATKGTPIQSIKGGIVYRVVNRLAHGEKGIKGQETGNYVVIKSKIDGKNVYFKYAHLDKINVEEGQTLQEEEVLGEAGTTGNAHDLEEDEQHVHVEASTTEQFYPGRGLSGTDKDTRVDPTQFFDTKFDENGKPIISKTKKPNERIH